MGLEAMCRDDEVLLHSVVIPPFEELVHRFMKGFASHPRASGIRIPLVGHAVADGRRSQDPQPLGYRPSDAVGDDHVGPDREVRTVLLQRPHRKNHPTVLLDHAAQVDPRQFIDRV